MTTPPILDTLPPMKTGILLTNLGTPDAPTPQAVKVYLKQFLSDPRVIEVPRAIWWFILNGVILPFRSRSSAKLYQSVWTESGSPLLLETQKQQKALQHKLGDAYAVAIGMRYGNPSLKAGLLELRKAGVDKVIVLPLYPQHSGTTTGSTFDEIARVLKPCRYVPELKFISAYYNHPLYIKACAEQINAFWQTHAKPDKLIFSFHGLPQKYVDKGDPYFKQCMTSAEGIAKALKLSPSKWMVTFQSRVGKMPWLQPYTDVTLQQLPTDGIQNVHVFCPGFSADCLETLEEIAEENKAFFLEAGGQAYHYIPALNDSPRHIEMMAALLQ